MEKTNDLKNVVDGVFADSSITVNEKLDLIRLFIAKMEVSLNQDMIIDESIPAIKKLLEYTKTVETQLLVQSYNTSQISGLNLN